MCHNTGVVKNAQIERFVEHGMPQKIVKTVKYTLRKRAQELSSASRAIVANVDYDTAAMFVPEEESKSHSRSACPFTGTRSSVATNVSTPLVLPALPRTDEPRIEVLEKARTELKIPKLCGRFRQMQQQNGVSSLSGATPSSSSSASPSTNKATSESTKVYVDALAVGTQLTKQFARRLSRKISKMQSSKIYTLLTRTTQPAHVIAICILSFVLLTVWPQLIEEKASKRKTDVGANHTLAAIAYLGAFATHFGAQIWMTFVSGLSLYFSLPRHTFGQCQQILFPKYFALNSVLSISMLILYVKYFHSPWSSTANCVQLIALTLTAVIEVTVRLYAAPPLLRLMHEKYKIEGAIGSGREVGDIVQGDLVQCPHYQRIHKAFRRIHMTVAMGNMTVLLATCLHLYFLASKIQIS